MLCSFHTLLSHVTTSGWTSSELTVTNWVWLKSFPRLSLFVYLPVMTLLLSGTVLLAGALFAIFNSMPIIPTMISVWNNILRLQFFKYPPKDDFIFLQSGWPAATCEAQYVSWSSTLKGRRFIGFYGYFSIFLTTREDICMQDFSHLHKC